MPWEGGDPGEGCGSHGGGGLRGQGGDWGTHGDVETRVMASVGWEGRQRQGGGRWGWKEGAWLEGQRGEQWRRHQQVGWAERREPGQPQPEGRGGEVRGTGWPAPPGSLGITRTDGETEAQRGKNGYNSQQPCDTDISLFLIYG